MHTLTFTGKATVGGTFTVLDFDGSELVSVAVSKDDTAQDVTKRLRGALGKCPDFGSRLAEQCLDASR